MLAKLKTAGKSSMLPVSGASTKAPPNSPVKGSKKRKKRGKRKRKEKKSEESSEEEDDKKTVEQAKVTVVGKLPANQQTANLPGQVTTTRPNPSTFAAQVLQSERPDLTATSALTPEETRILDDHLLKKGAFKVGNTITLGKIVDMNSKLQVGSGDEVEVGALQALGRFGALYVVYKEHDSELEKRGLANYLALKISRRHLAAARIQHELQILEHLYSSNNRKNVAYPTHITPLFFHGTAGGTPYLIMPMMDVNLEKIVEEIGGKLPLCDVFYIAQETLKGIKDCHTHSIIHRDIKPTNILLSMQNNKSWWLCDFGDACSAGGKRVLSPVDSCTLPFLSRDAHGALRDGVPATVKMDMESWFYTVLNLFTPLPWKVHTEEPETLQAKQSFWKDPDVFFNSNEQIPTQVKKLAKIVNGQYDEHIYNTLTAVLKDGFHKTLEGAWKPSWLEKRKRNIIPVSNRKPRKKKEEKEKEKEKGKKK